MYLKAILLMVHERKTNKRKEFSFGMDKDNSRKNEHLFQAFICYYIHKYETPMIKLLWVRCKVLGIVLKNLYFNDLNVLMTIST
jgi:hypothetical protein